MNSDESSDSEEEFAGFPDESNARSDVWFGFDGGDELEWLLKRFRNVKDKSDFVNVVWIPDGDESEAEELDDEEGDEIDQLYSTLPLPSNIEVVDPESESDAAESDVDEENLNKSEDVCREPESKKRKKQAGNSGKGSKDRQRCNKGEQRSSEGMSQSKRDKQNSLAPEWLDFDQETAEPPQCGSFFSPPPRSMTPYQYFSTMFTKEMIATISVESNRYCNQQSNYDPLITPEDIEQFMGMLLLMSIVKMPSFRMFWAAEPRYSPIADIMPRNRFEEIKRYLHFNDNTNMQPKGTPGYDKLFKIRPFLDSLRENFLQIEPEPDQSIDEIMVPTKARCNLRQFNPKKPTKFGVKITGRAGRSGILHDFEVYEGKGVEAPSALGVSGDIVLKLASTLEEGMHFRLYADNWFSSYALATTLKGKGFEYTGTIRRNRIPNITLKSDETMNKEGRGSTDAKISGDGIRIVKWKDNKIIHLITTYDAVFPDDSVKRWSTRDKRFVEVQRPSIVKNYNQSMGGIDLNDQLVAIYRTSVGTKKYYFRLYNHMLDVCVVNAWLLQRRHLKQRGEEKFSTLLQFKMEVASTLIRYGQQTLRHRGRPTKASIAAASRKHRKVVIEPSIDVRFDETAHWPEAYAERQRCIRCNDRSKFTFFRCTKCQEPLCIQKERNCFKIYHVQ